MTSITLLLKLSEWLITGVLLIIFFVIVSPLLPTKNLISSFAVVSGSMEPAVPVGTLTFVQQLPADQYREGDIIAFSEPGNPKRTILHRISEVQSSGITEFKTKGDNNDARDNWSVNAGQVKGKMFTSIPYIGYPIQFAQTLNGFLLLIGTPALILTLLQLKTIYEGIQEEINHWTQKAIQKHHEQSSQGVV